jgi:hypothetical protein
MIKLCKIFTALILFLGLTPVVHGQVYKYSNEFLSLGIGARAYGMGGAVVSSVNDVNAGYWNPAGLVEIKDNIQLCFMHNEQFAGIAKHDYGAGSFKINDKSVMAFSVVRYGIDDIPNTLNLFQNGVADYSRIVNFSAVDYAFIGSYARVLPFEGLAAGGSVKIIRRVVGDFANAWGFGFDLGVKYKYKKWNLGAVLRDATSTFNAWQYTFSEQDKQIFVATNNQLPSNNLEITVPKFGLGFNRKFNVYKDMVSIQPELNAEFTFDGKRNTLIGSDFTSIDTKMGIEAGYKEFVFLRGGISQFQTKKNLDGTETYSVVPTLGIGIKLNNLIIDYALADVGKGSGTLPFSNIISLRLSINRQN